MIKKLVDLKNAVGMRLITFLQNLYFFFFRRFTSKVRIAQFKMTHSVAYWVNVANENWFFLSEDKQQDDLTYRAAITILYPTQDNFDAAKEPNPIIKALLSNYIIYNKNENYSVISEREEKIKKMVNVTIERFSKETELLIKRFKVVNKLYQQVMRLPRLSREEIGPVKKCEKYCKKINKIYKKQLLNSKKIISNARRSKLKIQFDFISFIKAAGVAVPTFSVVGGFLYSWFLLRHFSIHVTDYFSLIDYETSSLEQSIKATVFVGIAIAWNYLVSFYSEGKPNYTQQQYQKQISRILFMTAVFIMVPALAYSIQAKNIMNIISITLCLFLPVIPFVASKFFKNPLPAIAFIASFMFFSVFILGFADDHAKNILDGKEKGVHVYLKKGSEADINHPVMLIENSSQYSFFYDPVSKKTIIIPVANIDTIKEY